MTITINSREYPFNIQGTVGLVYLAQRILGDEKFDGNNQYHQIVLYYAAFHQSNKNVNDLPDLQDFMASMTTKMMTDITTYFWTRWNELEGITPGEKPKDEKEGDGKGED